MTGRRKFCKLCLDKVETIDYKDVRRLEKFMTDRAKVVPRRVSGMCARHQVQVSRAIKRARFVAILPYSSEHKRRSR